jgi:hypothetical protein
MQIRLIEGLHLTATNKRHLAEIIGKGWTAGQSKRIAYTVTPITGEVARFPTTGPSPKPMISGGRHPRGRGIIEVISL